ncbi:hypothetical protein [Reichenbachiella sp. MALMAid0571]|uniref:hypothetical protein n=1 Tax=Reichenbachiella sp. MALMAid0571 TaxID=3143939 RepID=UPI0032DEC52D
MKSFVAILLTLVWCYACGQKDYRLIKVDNLVYKKNIIFERDLSSPNFKEFQMKRLSDGGWEKVKNSIDVTLTESVHEIAFRVVNKADVASLKHNVKVQLN